ncbi:hypothetical protein [Ralstonia phage phiRSL1]|uniref:Uncharacterized protein n=1 Tax=Ralstonia phage phiRSL1 TaxID=1980924 RepID=C4T8X4_9CAUD|nr:hypothetical protein RSL1_ORF287 [Ralstonia phage phiRSL1]BAH72948.1 hypothetical protein [Ralstonia phage phiRSL1]
MLSNPIPDSIEDEYRRQYPTLAGMQSAAPSEITFGRKCGVYDRYVIGDRGPQPNPNLVGVCASDQITNIEVNLESRSMKVTRQIVHVTSDNPGTVWERVTVSDLRRTHTYYIPKLDTSSPLYEELQRAQFCGASVGIRTHSMEPSMAGDVSAALYSRY